MESGGTYVGLELSNALTKAFLDGATFAALEIQQQLRDQGVDLELISPDGSPVRYGSEKSSGGAER